MSNVLFKWDENEYGIKVKSMDEEHQHLIRLMNTLHQEYLAKQPFELLQASVGALASYTIQHFSDEEKYMESIGFDGLKTHKIIHQKLLEEVTNHVNRFEKTKQLDAEFFNFLKMWLQAHICGIDIKYGNFANSKAA